MTVQAPTTDLRYVAEQACLTAAASNPTRIIFATCNRGRSAAKRAMNSPYPYAARTPRGPSRRHGLVDQAISEHRVAEGPANERCHHRVSQGRVPLSQPKVRKILDTTPASTPSRSPVTSGNINAALNVLEAQALFDGPQRKVSLGLAEHDGLIYLNLADGFWRCAEIGANGWRIVEDPPVRFCRIAACSHFRCQQPGLRQPQQPVALAVGYLCRLTSGRAFSTHTLFTAGAPPAVAAHG